MNSFELNKIFGAILGALVFVMGIGFIAEAIYRPIEDRGATYLLPEPELGEGEEPAAVAETAPIAARIQTATAEAGERLMNRCQSCHDYSPANAHRTGPGIYDVMGQVVAHHDDFNYSDIFIELRDEEVMWDYENMDAFLESPRHFAPGTRMTFAGLSNPDDRANMIAFLRTLSDDPIDLPEAPAEDVTADAAPEDGAPAGETDGEAARDDQMAMRMENATADAGERLMNRCQACHDYSPANAHRMGPGIYDVMGQVVAHHDDYNYSDIFVQLREEGEMWDYENMDAFLESPHDFAPGTRMSFPGLANPEDRANMMAFLRTLSDDPIDLPGGAAAEDAAADDAADAPATDDGAPVVEVEQAEPGPGDALGEEEADAPAPDAQQPQTDADVEAPEQDQAQ